MNIKEFSQQLNESGIRIPKGTHAAKIIHHQDMDGVFSAIIVFNQLIKQGISPKNIVTQWIQYGDSDNEYIDKLKKSKGQMVALVDFARIPEGAKPDFWSDHHQSDNKKGAGGGRIGATEFKSDTAHLALLHTNNMVDSATIEVINKIDSATYTSIDDVLTLRKDFKEKGRLERLGIICNALLVDSGILKDNSLLENFIKTTKPNLLSFYTNILEHNRLNDIQEEALKELKKANPDWDMIERSRRIMPNKKTKNRIQKGSSVNESALSDYEELQSLRKKKRNKEEEKRYRELLSGPVNKIKKSRYDSIQKERGKDSGFEKRGSTLIQNTSRLQRYIWSQLNTAGVKYPFVIKRYPTFIQVSINPDLPNEVREKIDLGKVSDRVMENIKTKFQNKYNEWAFNIIDKEKGGHKGITNIPALGTLGIMNKADREEFKYLKSLEDRIKKLKKYKGDMSDKEQEQLDKAKEMLDRKEIEEVDYTKLKKYLSAPMRNMMPDKFERLGELKDKKAKFAEKRKKIMDEIIEEFIDQFEKEFGASKTEPKIKDTQITGGKKEYEFESLMVKLKKEIL